MEDVCSEELSGAAASSGMRTAEIDADKDGDASKDHGLLPPCISTDLCREPDGAASSC